MTDDERGEQDYGDEAISALEAALDKLSKVDDDEEEAIKVSEELVHKLRKLDRECGHSNPVVWSSLERAEEDLSKAKAIQQADKRFKINPVVH